MADAVIDLVGMDDLPRIVELYNQIYRPSKSLEHFRRRFADAANTLQLVARLDDQPVGFFLGFELTPETFHAGYYGVLSDARRMGIGSQLLEAAQSWAEAHGYESIRLECHNSHRPMLHLAVDLGYDVVGLRWDTNRGDNLIIFEKNVSV